MCPALFYKLPILFSRVKLKAKHNFSQFIHRSKIGIFECWSQVALSKFALSKFSRWVRLSIWEGIFQKKFILLRWKFLSGFLVVSVFLSISFDNGWEDFLPVQSSYFRNFGAKTLGTYNPSHIPQVVVETTVSDETAFNSNWLFAKVPLLSHFIRLWG